MHRDGCSFMANQPCQRCKYTTSVDIQKTRYEKLVTHVEPHASAVSLLKRAENSAIIISDHHSINQSQTDRQRKTETDTEREREEEEDEDDDDDDENGYWF